MKQTGKARFGFLAIVSLVVVLLVASGGVVADDGAHTSDNSTETTNEGFCEFENPEWRDSQTIAGVDIAEERVCQPDNPNTVVAVTKGTNNVPMDVLMKTGLDEKTVVKKNDRDGDGDPDEIHISLEVMGINEHNRNAVNYSIAPGIKPSFWVFAPKTNGMVEDGSKASNNIRMPSPTIRAEQGDTVYVHVENTHYMPHTIHFHGVDHPYKDSEGGGNDGVPQTSEKPIMPGESRTYEMTARQAGTMFYHCHVVPNVHVKMGLNGMFVITEESANNTVQTLNIGAGKVRSPSNTMDEEFDGEYDLVYQEVDKKLVNIPDTGNMTAAELSYKMHRKYDTTEAKPDYFMLNGKSFPSTVKESLIRVEPNKEYHFNTLNAGSKTYSIHPHGHKFTITAYDGVELNESQQIQRDVLSITAAQRVDFTINTTDNGLDSYGSGVWFFHDHDEKSVTNNGISPGGTVTLIAYDEYVQENGTPITSGIPLTYYDKAYYNGEKPMIMGEKYKWDKAFESDTSEYSQYQNTTTPHSDSHSSDGHHSSSDSGGMMSGMMMDMQEVENGTIVNENTGTLPAGCTEISGTETLTIDAGTKYANDSQIFSYDREELQFDKCSKVTVTLNNTDDVRHQWMIHGLPMDTYPMGMFNIEADAKGEVTATFITPGTDTTLNIHCSLPTHEEMGMQQTLVIGEGGSNNGGHHSGDGTTTHSSGDGHDHTHAPPSTDTGGQQPSLVEFGAVVVVLALLGGGIAVLAMRYRD